MKVINEFMVNVASVVVSQRPIFKCRACPDYATTPSCPPHTPSVADCREWVGAFKRAMIIKYSIESGDFGVFVKEKRAVQEHLLEREMAEFKAGNGYAMALFPGSCVLCETCSFIKAGECIAKNRVRPSVDAVGIEIARLVNLDFNENALYGMVFID